MQSFVKAAVMLAFLSGGSFALPTDSAAVAQRDTDFFLPFFRPSYSASANGPITANGANGGYNEYGSGANGGQISVNRREEDFFWPIYRPYSTSANGPISASGANGGYNYGGNGANGGSISINRREDDFFWPIFRPYSTPANGPISASGANGGYNYGGNGANGGTISIGRREEDFLFPIGFGWNQPQANGAITANGANGGTNYYGNGANGGRISINRREDDTSLPSYGGGNRWNYWGWYRPTYSVNDPITSTPPVGTYPVKRPIIVSGQNGGTSRHGDGANGGSISVGPNSDEIVVSGVAE